jgi:hypothetical protein
MTATRLNVILLKSMYALRIGLEMGMVFSRISTIFTEYSVWGLMFENDRHCRGCWPMLIFLVLMPTKHRS